MPLTPTPTGYQLPRVNPMGQMPMNKQGLVNKSAAQMQQYSPAGQRAQFQQQATAQAADPNADPMQNFYNSQQLYDMTLSEKTAEEAKKKALEEQYAALYAPKQEDPTQQQQQNSRVGNFYKSLYA